MPVGGSSTQPQTNVARNFPRSFFETTQKRCNSNDTNSKFEILTGELRATLLCDGRAGSTAVPVNYGAWPPCRWAAPSCVLLHVAQLWLSISNFARNSPASSSNLEFAPLELQRFWVVWKNDRGKLRATFVWGRALSPPINFACNSPERISNIEI